MPSKKPDEPTPSIEEFAEERHGVVLRETEKLRADLRTERQERKRLERETKRLKEELGVLERVRDEALALTPQPEWLKDGGDSSSGVKRATLLAVLSDVHAGELVNVKEIGGYNAYNLQIADYRLHRYFEKTIMLSRNYLAGVTFDGIVLAFGGDMISGEIHDELAQTNELSVFESVLWLAPRLVAGIERWAEEFGKVHVVNAPGNHPRDSWKPRYKARAVHNADYLLAQMVATYFQLGNPAAGDDVTFDIPKSIDVDFSIYDYSFSLEHGEELQKTNPGTSEIGALGPVKRGTLRKSRQRQAEGHKMDYLVVGHFHQYVDAHEQGFVMNGSLKGYDEFARGLHLKPEPAQQAILVVTPEYGPTQGLSVKVSKRSEEGW